MSDHSVYQEARKHPGVEREYKTDQIIVHWEPQLCIHTARCLKSLPEVFDVNRRPWVDVHAASPDEIADVVMRCPTGALRFTRLDGSAQEESPHKTQIQVKPNGPLYLRGNLVVVDQDGEVKELPRTALCRCGQSGNKPFCDNTHLKVDFRTVE